MKKKIIAVCLALIAGIVIAQPYATGQSIVATWGIGRVANIALTDQTGASTWLLIPDFAGVYDEFTFKTKAQTMSNKTFVAPVLGAATGTSLNLGGTGVLSTTATSGSGSLAMTTSPVFVTPLLGTPTSGIITNLTGNADSATVGGLLKTTGQGASMAMFANSENIVLSTSGSTTDSSGNLLPADSIIDAVVCRLTAAIVTATDWGISDPTTTLRFSPVSATLTLGTTIVGLKHLNPDGAAAANGMGQAAAAKLRITTTGTPTAGAARCTVFGRTFVAPTS